ncbi:MAG: zf-HC2 domain-containing protein [Betaproteobacteria bacterium]|nr:zf-HC2 domain-containing protein [Betaproteobacteria bacterium]
MLACREVSKLLSEARERRLGLWERISLKLHLAMCDGCNNFSKQLDFIGAALRRYRDRDHDD